MNGQRTLFLASPAVDGKFVDKGNAPEQVVARTSGFFAADVLITT